MTLLAVVGTSGLLMAAVWMAITVKKGLDARNATCITALFLFLAMVGYLGA